MRSGSAGSSPDDGAQEEFADLARSAGASIAAVITARVDKPSPATYIGSGKLDEVKAAADATGADLILVNHSLSPGQERNLEKFLERRVLDRTGLILDIFAQRARSFEGKLQVELAQLQHMATRLVRGWTHLERQRGGSIGLRGPGETQLETDRRLLQKRVDQLQKRLEKVEVQQTQMRRARVRSEMPRVALVGYTNAGKSSILRGMSGTEVFVEDRLFATLDPTTRAIDVGEGSEVLLTDTVGFIRKLPHHLVASFRATLEEAAEADLLLHVIDASHHAWEEQMDVVREVLADLKLRDRPTVLIFNKTDRLTHDEEQALRERTFAEPSIFVNTVEEGGLEPLRQLLHDEVRKIRPDVELTLSSSQGGLLAEIYREGEVLSREDNGSEIHLRARLPNAALGRLKSRGVKVYGAG
jgi:GTP-binding protein HflX